MQIIDWDGGMITEPGLYRGIPLSVYHNDTKLLSGPSVSKSAIKHIAPPNGSPKKFWKFWSGNPDRKIVPPTKAMIFGKAVHALLLGDEVFDEKFVVRPERVNGELYHGRKKVWIEWYKAMAEEGYEVLTIDEIEQIRAMSHDAAEHPLVVTGGLNGEVEISMFAKDPVTKIWLKSRPDVNVTDGIYNDLKTATSLEDDFLRRQFADAGYYIQAAMTKRICDLLTIPFISFGFLYVLSKDYADTEYRIADVEDIALGEALIDYALPKIRAGLTTGDWEGVAGYARENIPLRMTKWDRNAITEVLAKEGYWKL